jgi:ribosomal protein S6
METDHVTPSETSRDLYEIGYLLASSLVEDAVAGEVDKLKNTVVAHGGEVVASGAPDMITLAYPMSAEIDGSKRDFTNAFFGWLQFTCAADAVEAVDKDFDRNQSVIRHLLIKIHEVSDELDEEEAEIVAQMDAADELASDEEIDQKIDELVAE